MKNFWQELPKPIMAVAPMADVTDAAFRRLIAKYSAHERKDLPAPRPNIFFVYVILCENEAMYIGQTNDVARRWKEHQAGTAAEYTKKFKPRKVIHYEELKTRTAAVQRERELKTGFGRKWLKREYAAGRTRQAGGTVGGPDVMWTEFVAADGLMRATPEGKEKLMADLIYAEEERPIVAQLFTSNEEYMEAACKLCRELGFDGVDINMGCPDRTIEKQGCGSAMIKTPDVARRIIRAAKRGAGDIPVSVKTRLGYSEDELETWLPEILKEEPAVLTVHARTRKDMSKVPARWERIARVVELRDELKSETLILGNGDVLSLEDAQEKVAATGADGVMVGRALFGNPWFFNPSKRLPIKLTALPTKGVNRETLIAEDTSEAGVEYVTLEEKLRVLVEHTKLFEELLGFKNFAVMKKHYKAYVNGFPGAVELRSELMNTSNSQEVEAVVRNFLVK